MSSAFVFISQRNEWWCVVGVVLVVEGGNGILVCRWWRANLCSRWQSVEERAAGNFSLSGCAEDDDECGAVRCGGRTAVGGDRTIGDADADKVPKWDGAIESAVVTSGSIDAKVDGGGDDEDGGGGEGDRHGEDEDGDVDAPVALSKWIRAASNRLWNGSVVRSWKEKKKKIRN